MIHLAAQMDERTKRFLLVLCALLIILLLIFGCIYLIIDKYMKRSAKAMDTYMYPLLRYRIVKTRGQFLRALFYHEKRKFFNECKWGFRIIVLITLVALGLTYMLFEGQYVEFFTKALDVIPNVKWQTIGEINETLAKDYPELILTGPEWMPASLIPSFISKNPDFSNPMLYSSLIYYAFMLCALFILTKAVLAYIARFNRGVLMSKKVFEKNLEKLDLDAVNTYSESVNSSLPNTNEGEL